MYTNLIIYLGRTVYFSYRFREPEQSLSEIRPLEPNPPHRLRSLFQVVGEIDFRHSNYCPKVNYRDNAVWKKGRPNLLSELKRYPFRAVE